MPLYVFVRKDVLAQLRVWKANPDADYSSVVDTPRVFEFIDSFRADGEVWTFEFDTAEDIVHTLRKQFAYLVQDALELRQSARGQDPLLSELKGEALMLALRREQYWDVRLFAVVLQEELDRRTRLHREIELRLTSGNVTFVDFVDLESWMQDRLDEVKRLAHTATAILNDYLPQVRGEDAKPNELVAIARRLAQVWEDNAQWTLRCRSVRVDEKVERLVHLLSIANANMLDEIWEFGHTIIPHLDQAIEALATGGSAVLELELTLTADVDEFDEEMDRLQREL